jgi:hypothetical protein
LSSGLKASSPGTSRPEHYGGSKGVGGISGFISGWTGPPSVVG